MSDPTRGTDRGGRRAKRFLTPSQKYEIFLQLVRQEVTMAEAAEAWKVDRTTILRIRTVAKQGALDALAASRPGVKAAQRDAELDAARADAARLGEAVKEMAIKLMLVEGKGGLGLSGRVPARVDAATKTALLGLIDQAVAQGWTLRGAYRRLELGEVRAHRWRARRNGDGLDDKAPGGRPLHGLLPDEISEIVALYHEWGDIDRSHRKLAHRGSYLNRVWVSPASVRRVLAAQGLDLNPPPRPGTSVRKPFPDWVQYRPNQIWIYDTTHFTRAEMAVTIIEDLVSRKWIAGIVSAEETSTQVEIVFTDALAAEGLLALVEARADTPVDPDTDDDRLPILPAVSDNGSQMTSISTRKFMALCAIATHFGRPGTPTDQAWIESFNGHLKAENPHLEAITDPAVLRAELAVIRTRYNTVRLHAGIGYVTPDDEHTGRGPAIRKARETGLETARPRRLAYHRNQPQQHPNPRPHDDA